MRLLKNRRLAALPAVDPFAGAVRVHPSPCYDLLVSLRALFNPRTYEGTRAWANATRAKASRELLERGQFFFQGHDTSLGSGVMRLVAELPDGAGPDDLVRRVRAADPRGLVLLMLDTDETSEEALATFDRSIRTGATAGLARALRGTSAEWSKRGRRIITDPQWARAEFLALLREYSRTVFAEQVPHVARALKAGAERASELLGVLPTATAIEQLTGGYTLSAGLQLRRITLAPSAFIYPFMASRVDERSGQALVVFGVKSDALVQFDKARVDPDLVRAVKAVGDPARLKVLRLLQRGPLGGPELVSSLGLSAPTVHHHVHLLRAAGLVRQERTRDGMRYTIRRDSAHALLDALSSSILGGD